MLVALLLGMASLGMRSSKPSGTSTTYHEVPLAGVAFEGEKAYYPMGWELKPYSFTVVVCLLVIFVTPLCKIPFWRSYGYWISAILLFAYLPTQIGVVPWLSFIVSVWAAINHTGAGRALK